MSQRRPRALALLLLAMLCLGAAPTSAPDTSALPPAPEGFSWQRLAEIRAAVLMPAGWHFKAEAGQGKLAYYVSKESIEDGGKYQTGLAVEVMRIRQGSKASDFAKQLAAAIAKSGQVDVEQTWSAQGEAFQTLGARSVTHGRPPARIHTLMIANDKTGTLYVVLFEAPKDRWDEDWKLGHPIVRQLMLDAGS